LLLSGRNFLSNVIARLKLYSERVTFCLVHLFLFRLHFLFLPTFLFSFLPLKSLPYIFFSYFFLIFFLFYYWLILSVSLLRFLGL
jgi:hypothetical protein